MTVPTHKNSTQTSCHERAVCLGVSYTAQNLQWKVALLSLYICVRWQKAVFFSLRKTKEFQLKLPEKPSGLIYSKTLLNFLSFWKKQAACHLAGRIYQTSQFFGSIRATTGTAQHSKNTLQHLFSWKWAVCPKCLDTAWKLQESHFRSWVLCLMAKAAIFSWESKNIIRFLSRTLCFIYLFIKVKNLVTMNFLKQDAFYYFLGSYQIVQFCLIRVIQLVMVVNTTKTLFLRHPYSQGSVF